MKRILNHLEELIAIQGVPGCEENVIEKIASQLENQVDTLEIDDIGNLYALKKGQKRGPTLLIAAHADQIGAAVKYINQEGFIYFEKLGGLTDTLLQGQRVLVQGHFGVIGCKSGHYQKTQDNSVNYKHLYIDVGAGTKEEVMEMGINIGSSITYLDSIHYFSNPNRICCSALDNRLGCAILMEILAGSEEFSGDLLATFTVQEETGFTGAMTSTRKKPDLFLAVDTIPAGKTPDLKKEELISEIGKGPVIPVISGHDKKITFTNRKIRELLIKVAEEERIPYQLVIADRGNNDAAGPNLVGSGIPAASICIPRRYSHSPIEVADLGDVAFTFQVLTGFIKRMGDL